MIWLNDWESRVKNGSLNAENFLTYQTAEGLRMTLQSTIDISKYLLEVLKLDAVFTGRINQDPLEVSTVDTGLTKELINKLTNKLMNEQHGTVGLFKKVRDYTGEKKSCFKPDIGLVSICDTFKTS